MTSERWLDVERLYHAALERLPDERMAFLRDACGGDEALCLEVQSLLHESLPEDPFLEGPALDAAARLMSTYGSSHLVGRRLGEYELQTSLGVGGMGEVYRARDLKLGRDVAIKVLPSLLAHDRDRVARFRREAQILATLNHAHIAAIYALEESDGVLGLVLELVEGPTLADRLTAGPLPVHEALAIGRQTAEALEAAHAKGIIHRDLKPANIKVTPGGTVKVLDFGLATVGRDHTAPGVSGLPTLDATREGMIVGTATYMSPEQARGLAVDRCTDIWAFGCVLFEMLAGRKAFQGETIADYVAAILGREPEWDALPASTPPNVVAVLRRCFEKDAQRRLADIGHARRELEDVLASRSGRTGAAMAESFLTRRAPKTIYIGAVVGILIAGVAGVRAVRQMTLRAEPIDIALAGGEFIRPPTHPSWPCPRTAP